MDRVRAGVLADLTARLTADPMAVALRECIEGAGEVSASVLRHQHTVYGDPIRHAMTGVGHG